MEKAIRQVFRLLYKEVMFNTINSWITFYGVIPTTLLLRIHHFFPLDFSKTSLL